MTIILIKILAFLTKFIKSIGKLNLIVIFVLYSCSVPKALKPKKIGPDTPVNAQDRARKNVEEGRGVSLKGAIGKNRSTTYQFSTSNPLWRASLETIDFMPLTTVDYSGGIIITDWYSNKENPNEAIKITLRFLSNEIQSNSIKVILHNKNCGPRDVCAVSEIDSNIKFELQKSILSKAATLEKEAKKSKK
jgi:hypothetical protein